MQAHSFRKAIVAGLAGILVSCQSAPDKTAQTTQDTVRGGIDDAVLAPAEDLNLRRQDIPPILNALEAAYLDGTALSCAQIAQEITALTAELGMDEDELRHLTAPTRATKAGQTASEAALDAVEGRTTSFIPFRGVVRQVTGAAAHEKKLRAATLTGLKRRAYLKGIGAAKACAPPASPMPPPMVADEV